MYFNLHDFVWKNNEYKDFFGYKFEVTLVVGYLYIWVVVYLYLYCEKHNLKKSDF